MLALASLLERLREDPGTIGKRYQLAVSLDPGSIRDARSGCRASTRSGSATASTRRTRSGSASRSGSSPTPATTRSFEDPPLAEGRRIRGPNEVEVGVGHGRRARAAARLVLADADPRRRRGALPRQRDRARARERRPDRVGRSRTGCSPLRPDLDPQVVVRLEAGRRPGHGHARAVDLGARLQPVGAAQTDNAAFLAVLAAVLRGVGLAVGLVCLYALVQALTVTARERRGAVALLRACGADGPTVGLVLAGAAVAVAIPAALAGVVLEVVAFGPLVARLAAGFAVAAARADARPDRARRRRPARARGDRDRAGRAPRAARARRRGAEGRVTRAARRRRRRARPRRARRGLRRRRAPRRSRRGRLDARRHARRPRRRRLPRGRARASR